MGASLPAGFETDDAECYAVLKALREVCQRTVADGGVLADQRLLILSDCAPVVAQIERAYREETAEGLRATDRGAMLEAICALRNQLQRVVIMWAPSHEGVTPGGYADAAAKGGLERGLERGLTEGVAELVISRPCVYERQADGGAWELFDRPAFRGARRQTKGWVEAKLAAGLQAGAITAGLTGAWPDLLAVVAKGSKQNKNAQTDLVQTGLSPDEVNERNMFTAFTMGVRVGDVAGVRHGSRYARARKAERGVHGPHAREGRHGCAACWVKARKGGRGIAVPAAAIRIGNRFAALDVEEPVRHETLRHVIVDCKAVEGKSAMAEDMVVAAERMRSSLQGEAGEQPAVKHVERAREGWQAVAAGRNVTSVQWSAMHSTLAGALPKWEDAASKEGTAFKKAKLVAGSVRRMQLAARRHVEAHVQAGAQGAAWIKDRVQGAPWLQLVLRAWKQAACSGQRDDAAPLPAEAHLDADAWSAWKRRETKKACMIRRSWEITRRLAKFGRLVFAGEQKADRLTRIRSAFVAAAHSVILRRAARARSARRIIGLVHIARARAGARSRAVRPHTLLATVWSMHRSKYPPRSTARMTRLQVRKPRLINAARLGPVTDAFLRSLQGDSAG